MRYYKDKKLTIFAGSHSLLGFSPSPFIRWRVFLLLKVAFKIKIIKCYYIFVKIIFTI